MFYHPPELRPAIIIIIVLRRQGYRASRDRAKNFAIWIMIKSFAGKWSRMWIRKGWQSSYHSLQRNAFGEWYLHFSGADLSTEIELLLTHRHYHDRVNDREAQQFGVWIGNPHGQWAKLFRFTVCLPKEWELQVPLGGKSSELWKINNIKSSRDHWTNLFWRHSLEWSEEEPSLPFNYTDWIGNWIYWEHISLFYGFF